MIIKKHVNPFYLPSDQERQISSSHKKYDARDPFEKDYGRIVHSAAFRRLQAKTQVITSEVGDFHRTRLTHSMEVAQIARGIGISLNHLHPLFKEEYALDLSLIEAAALAHDLGHPPFGHRGEQALHQCMRLFGGFEGNAHTFRILTRLEGDRENGLNVTRGLLLSVMKYPILLNKAMERVENQELPPKASAFQSEKEAFQWALAPFSEEEKEFLQATSAQGRYRLTQHRTFECSIIELADDIAYGTHDFEDAIHLGLIRLTRLKELLSSFSNHAYPELEQAMNDLVQLQEDHDHIKYRLKKIFSRIISTFITHIQIKENIGQLGSPRLRFVAYLPDDLNQLLTELKQVVADQVISSQPVQIIAWKGSYMIQQMFQAMMNEERLLPEHDREKLSQDPSDAHKARLVCDYIAGMTDPFAMKMYTRLFGESWS
ncbi:dGTPase [Hazenella coriacea]|uniref:Deoxyguanosinetriphosphate triphosphohydrolase-like protein n=2 Tax=Hazenella coriacea TaxID=1179467 RepID=A0A4R3L9D4_9BACL|nr:dGTPase [Hazenella coriacea]